MTVLRRLTGRFTLRSTLVLAACATFWLAGRQALSWAVPGVSLDAHNLGLATFIFLTGTAAERAPRLLAWPFAAWVVAGLLLSVLVGLGTSA